MKRGFPVIDRWRRHASRALGYAVVFVSLLAVQSLGAKPTPPVVKVGKQGKLEYVVADNGDRLPDFSAAGYMGGGVAIPRVDAKVVVRPSGADDTARIQAALDYVSSLEPDPRGIRGAVELAAGRFLVNGQLAIDRSGVVLRGVSSDSARATLVATGVDRRSLVRVGDATEGVFEETRAEIADTYVPVGAEQITVASPHGFKVGDIVRIERPGSKEWVEELGMDIAPGRTPYNWRPETVALHWDRRIASVKGDKLTLEAPLTTALDRRFGVSTIRKRIDSRSIEQVGIENLDCVSEYDSQNPKDENHSWIAVDLRGVENGWVSDVTARHFALSAVRLDASCRLVTVQDCAYLEPVSEIGGYRRQSFHTSGQQTLFARCRAEEGLDDFTVGYLAGGPNVFLECSTARSGGVSGSIGHWASGILFDNVHVDGGRIALDNREIWNQGVGWAAANSMIYQSSAATIVCRRPPTAQNWAMGVWAQYIGDGAWIQVSEFADPDSLYRAQLTDRLGASALAALEPRRYVSNRMAVPELEQVVPALPKAKDEPLRPLVLRDGWLSVDGALLTGKPTNITWWRGRLLPTRSDDFGYSVTRFTPGRIGSGLTDELDEMTDEMTRKGEVSLRHHYGLWYDRRRDDHQMTRREDGDVWPPFYEQPFARSGQGTAWDGLSKYDLSKYNPWYFGRLQRFANLAEKKGLVLINEMYFQHNIIESGAHWVDNPWRSTNAIQATGFVEPPPFTGDTIKMADAFYDVSHPERRALHRAYIRQCLDNLAGEPNVIHVIGAEYTGPLHFMEFWLDVVGEWETETGQRPLIGLSCTKDVQDAILADAKRSELIDVIEFQYWWYTDNDAFTPQGGISLAPRQNERLWKGGRPSGASMARMANEYRIRFPDKAVISAIGVPDPWAFVAAGGSMAPLPGSVDRGLLALLAQMKPIESPANAWMLGDDAGQRFIYARDRNALERFTPTSNDFELLQIDLRSGALQPTESVRDPGAYLIRRRTRG